jgi:hypothetical protein
MRAQRRSPLRSADTPRLGEQRCEVFALNERGLFRVAQPITHFFDEQRMLASVRFGHVDMGERRGNVTPKLHEMSQGERSSVESGFRFERNARSRHGWTPMRQPVKPVLTHNA